MKKKDLATLIVAVILFVGALILLYFMLFPSKPKTNTAINSTVTKQNTITGNIDSETLTKLNSLKSYGSTNLNNIGRTNPFGPLE